MATPVRFDALRESVRVLYQLPDDFDTDTPITLEEVNSFINGAVRAYFGILIELRRDEYMTFEELITVSAASFDTSALTAARFHDVRRAQWVRGTDDIVPILPASPDDWYLRSESARTWDSSTCPKFDVVRSLLYFFPVPSSSYSVRLWYTGIPVDLVSDANSIDGGPGWEDYVVADACLNIARNQEEDEKRWKDMRDDAERSIRGQKKRNRSAAGQVRDSRGVRPASRVGRRFPWSP